MFRMPKKRKSGSYAGKYAHITKEHLQAEIAAGKTVMEIAHDNDIPFGSMSGLLKRHGLSARKPIGEGDEQHD